MLEPFLKPFNANLNVDSLCGKEPADLPFLTTGVSPAAFHQRELTLDKASKTW